GHCNQGARHGGARGVGYTSDDRAHNDLAEHESADQPPLDRQCSHHYAHRFLLFGLKGLLATNDYRSNCLERSRFSIPSRATRATREGATWVSGLFFFQKSPLDGSARKSYGPQSSLA